MNKNKERYIVQFMSPAAYQKNYKVYDTKVNKVIDSHTTYDYALHMCNLLNRAESHGWEPILTQQEPELGNDY